MLLCSNGFYLYEAEFCRTLPAMKAEKHTLTTENNYYDQARACIRTQHFDEAVRLLRQSLDSEETAAAWHDIGVIHFMHGRHHEAIAALQAAVKLDPGYDQAYANLARITVEMGRKDKALEYSCLAIEANPGNVAYKEDFVRIARHMGFLAFYPPLKTALIRCLEEKNIYHQELTSPWRTTVKFDPALKPLRNLLGKDYKKFSRDFPKLAESGCLSDPVLILALKRLSIPDLEFERLLTHLRRWLLDHIDSFKNLALAAALAEYCFYSDYVFNFEPEEQQAAERLRHSIEAGALNPYAVAVLGCYTPLCALSNAAALLQQEHKEIADLLRVQIAEPLREQEIRKTIPALTVIEDELSQAVRAFYEDFPYPKWKSFDTNLVVDIPGPPLPPNPRILIAGCGTGNEAMIYARAFPQADILAVDLSLSSLSYAIRKTEEFGAKNITFHQADLLQLGGIEKRFDVICCSGVLVCVEDPARGWAVLASLLKDTGLMRIALYSETGRRDVVKARRIIHDQNIPSDRDGIRFFRKNCEKLMPKKMLPDLLERRDFYNMPECKDLLFHFKENRFELAQIQAMAKKLGLSLIHFDLPPNVLEQYRRDYPGDTQINNLDSLSAFEQKNPMAFQSMYNFWCAKN
jgi:ubiquinone/menaquinone biosynthesis C-methylase UbiE